MQAELDEISPLKTAAFLLTIVNARILKLTYSAAFQVVAVQPLLVTVKRPPTSRVVRPVVIIQFVAFIRRRIR